MGLVFLSLITGYIGLNIGGIFGAEIFMYLFGLVGVLTPALFILDNIQKELKSKN